MSVAMLLMLAVMGLAFDFGRIYIARNEAQVFTDAAAMTAVAKLDGTEAGVTKARESVARLPMRWNLGTQSFTGVVLEFSEDGERWDASPHEYAGLAYARVTAPDNQIEITFLQAVGGPKSFMVPARSAAAANPVRLIQ
jgi:uncharacterized membrane protein